MPERVVAPPPAADSPDLPDLLAGLDVPRVPQQARSRQKREALLVAAARLFEAQGYDETTADDIAAGAGVSIGTFYSYFRNKRQVFLTLFASCVDSILALGIAAIDFSHEPRRAIRETVEQALQRDPFYYSVRDTWYELLSRDPAIAEFDAAVTRLIYGQILVAVRKVAAQGLTWPDLDVEPTCWAIMRLLHDAWRSEPKPGAVPAAQIHRQRQAVADLIYHALIRG